VARVDAERASQARFDDEAADAVRTAAPEARAFLEDLSDSQ
jgi:glycerol-3-phosphate dehydrogenase